MAVQKVLLIEDDLNIVELVKLYLRKDGYKVIATREEKEALRLARENRPDIIVLDLQLLGIDSLELCRTLKDESDISVVILTTNTLEEEHIKALELGVDDYITKPFSPRELTARIRVILRRRATSSTESGQSQIHRNKLTVDFLKMEVSIDGTPISLTQIEFKILGILIKEPAVVFSRTQLTERAVGFNNESLDRSIDAHISNLRHKLESVAGHHNYIKTVYGHGYKFADS